MSCYSVGKRAAVFIDGSNFYYSSKIIGITLSALNFPAFCQDIVSGKNHTLSKVHYYAGSLRGDELKRKKQEIFFTMLDKQGVVIQRGRTKKIGNNIAHQLLKKWLMKNQPGADISNVLHEELVEICDAARFRYQEKEVDMMCGADMVNMAMGDNYDVAYLISADGDFAPIVKMVSGKLKKAVYICSPGDTYKSLSRGADGFIEITADKLLQFGGKKREPK